MMKRSVVKKLGLMSLRIILVIAILTAVMASGCNQKRHDQECLAICQEILRKWGLSIFISIPSDTMTEMVYQVSQDKQDQLLIGAHFGPMNSLYIWVDELNGFHCRDSMLELARRNLLLSLELEISGLNELLRLMRGDQQLTREAVEREVDRILSTGIMITQYREIAERLISWYCMKG